ncbi:MAG: hypothetical protein ACREUX_23650 [Burkholderiales bacterium]
MIFMSQSGLTDPARESDWDAWYIEHLRVMVSVEGVESAQRFKTASPGHPPSTAMYSMQSAAVFQDPYYLSVRGLGEFLPLIDRRYYRRNLFAGLDLAPVVASDQVMLIWDAAAPCAVPGVDFRWLEAVAVDKSTPYRGIAVIPAEHAAALRDRADIACYVPVTRVFHKDT